MADFPTTARVVIIGGGVAGCLAALGAAEEQAEDRADNAERHQPGESGSGDPVESDIQLARALEVLKSWTYFERFRNHGSEAPIQQARVTNEP